MSQVKIGIIGGTGLDKPDLIENKTEVTVDTIYESVDVICGKISGVECVLLSRHGRSHNVMPSDVNYRANISALKILGCTHVIATTATGSLKQEITPGSIVILNDFIDRTKNRKYTFFDNTPGGDIGVCHMPMSPSFDEKTRQVIIEAAKECSIDVFTTGTVVVIEGPRYSTKAESNVHRSWGCDLVGMTACPEVNLAKEKGLLYASIAMATDYDCWQDTKEGVCVEEVMTTFKKNVEKVTKIILKVVPKIAKIDWTQTIEELDKVVKSSIMLPDQYSK